MRVVHLVNRVAHPGNGIANFVVDLACEQQRNGHEVFVLSVGDYYRRLLESQGVTYICFDQTRSRRLIGAAKRLRGLLRSIRPDIVHAHTVTGVVLARASTVLKRHWRLVTTIHVERPRARITRLADEVVVLSDQGRQQLAAGGVPSTKLHVIKNGIVGGVRLDASAPEAPDVQRPAVLTVCGLNYRKGVDLVVQAFAKARRETGQGHLYIVGEGPEEDALHRLADTLHVAEHITFTGVQPSARPWMSASDVFVLLSRNEPGALVLIEARAAGLPIVASAAGGNPNMLDGGRAGCLVPTEDPEAAGAALRRLINDPTERAALAAAAVIGLDNLTVSRMAADYDHLYQLSRAGR